MSPILQTWLQKLALGQKIRRQTRERLEIVWIGFDLEQVDDLLSSIASRSISLKIRRAGNAL
jgi:hypothetical protein